MDSLDPYSGQVFVDWQRLRQEEEVTLRQEKELHLRKRRREEDRHAARKAAIAAQFRQRIAKVEAQLHVGLQHAQQQLLQRQPQDGQQPPQPPAQHPSLLETGAPTVVQGAASLAPTKAMVANSSEHTVQQQQACRQGLA